MHGPRVGILEHGADGFARALAAALADVPVDWVRAGQSRQPADCPWRVVVDRLSFCDPWLRSLVRAWSVRGAYVLNDPFYTLVHDKLSELSLHDALGIRHPRTLLLPRPHASEPLGDIVDPPDWSAVGDAVGFPCWVKPLDGYAWQDVFRAENLAALRGLYESMKDRRSLIVQEHVAWTAYYRAFCVDRRDVYIAGWTPRPFDEGEYFVPPDGAPGALGDLIAESTRRLNAAAGVDFNAVEWCVTPRGEPVLIDSYNDVPDVRREKLPPACWDWIVDRVAACVRARLAAGERNLLAPPLPART